MEPSQSTPYDDLIRQAKKRLLQEVGSANRSLTLPWTLSMLSLLVGYAIGFYLVKNRGIQFFSGFIPCVVGLVVGHVVARFLDKRDERKAKNPKIIQAEVETLLKGQSTEARNALAKFIASARHFRDALRVMGFEQGEIDRFNSFIDQSEVDRFERIAKQQTERKGIVLTEVERALTKSSA